MVPVVGGVAVDPAPVGVTHNGDQRLLGIGTRLADLHERHGIDPEIGVAPVGLEARLIGLDRLVELALSAQGRALAQALPAVLVDAAEQPIGLAAGAEVRDDCLQRLLRVLRAAGPVEREPVLLAHQPRAPDGLGHRLGDPDHVVPRLGRAVGEQEVDQHAGLDVAAERAEVVFDRAHGRLGIVLLVGAACGGKTLLDRRGVLSVARNTSVLSRSMSGWAKPSTRRGTPGCRASPWPTSPCGLQRGDQHGEVFVDVRRPPPAIQLVGQHPVGSQVERDALDVRVDEHGRVRPDRVPDAQLVEDVGVGGGEVDNGVVGQDQPLVHRLVDQPAHQLLVGPQRHHRGRFDGGCEQLCVHGVEVHDTPARVWLGAERHDDEAQWIERHEPQP